MKGRMTEQELAALEARARFVPDFEPYGGAMTKDGAYPYAEARGPALQISPPVDPWGDASLVVSEHYQYPDVLCALFHYAKPTVLSLAAELRVAWNRIRELENGIEENQRNSARFSPPRLEARPPSLTLRACGQCGKPTARSAGICASCEIRP